MRTSRVLAFASATALATSLLVGAGTAGAAPAQSTKILPGLKFADGAVDSKGGSLVVGVREELDADDGLLAYRRDAKGHWGARESIPIGGGYFAPDIASLTVVGGGDGYFAVAWLAYQSEESDDPAILVSVSDRPGHWTTKTLFEVDNQSPPAIALNASGDLAVTQTRPTLVSRYVRGLGWKTVGLPAETAGVPDDGARLMLSNARSIDITYTLRSDGRSHVVQRTMPYSATTFGRTDIYTAPDTTVPNFGITMDTAGLQTLAIDDSDDAIKIYRESVRRGPFVYEWRKPRGDAGRYAPHIDTAGTATRVTWTAELDGAPWGQTRLFTGSGWLSSRRIAVHRYEYSASMAIGTDGRGAEAGRQAGEFEETWLERTSTVPAGRETDGLVEGPGVSVGDSSVSQTVSVEHVPESEDTRTVVLVRR